MKKLCPFGEKRRCTIDCEWFEVENDKCAFLVLKNDVSKLINIIYGFMSRDMQIKAARKKLDE